MAEVAAGHLRCASAIYPWEWLVNRAEGSRSSYIGFDSIVARNVHITESWRAPVPLGNLQTFSSPEFDLPNQTLGGGGYGLVTGAGNSRIRQMGLYS
jgi:hypothetical protein